MIKYYKNNYPVNNLWISAGIYSLIFFSELSVKIFNIGGRYIFEAALAVGFIYYLLVKDKIGKCFEIAFRKKSNVILLSGAVMGLIFFIGWMGSSNFIDAYSDYRANFIFVLGFFLARHLLITDSYKILILAIATSFISILHWFFLYKTGNLGVKNTVPLFSCVMALFLSLEHRKWSFVIYSVLSLLFLAAVSFIRQYWIIAILSIVISFLKVTKFSVKSIVNASFLLVVILGIVYMAYDPINHLLHASESNYIQSIGKTQEAIDILQGGRGSDSDNLRLAYLRYMIENASNLVLPHGLGHNSLSKNFDPWFYKYTQNSGTIDSAFLYVVYHYGYLIFAPLIYWYIKEKIKLIKSDGIFLSLLLFVIFLIPGFFDGGQLTVISRAFWFGVFCAYAIRYRYAADALHKYHSDIAIDKNFEKIGGHLLSHKTG